jgi:uncharacterized membrane protein YvbJ
MYCPKCGSDNPGEARFCGKCSTALPSGAAPPQPVAPPWAGGTGNVSGQAVSPGLKMGIGISSVLLPIIGFIMGIIYMMDANPEKKAVGKFWLLMASGGMVLYCMISLANR